MIAWILLLIAVLYILINIRKERYTVYVHEKETNKMFEVEINEKQEIISKKEITAS